MKYKCGCKITEGMTYDELKAAMPSCTESLRHPYICPNMVREQERARKEERSKSYRKKKMKQNGFSDEEIKKSVGRKKTNHQNAKLADLSVLD